MKKPLVIILTALMLLLSGCGSEPVTADIVATTLPVYDFTARITAGTDLTVSVLVTESVSCLHDYSLQVHQMRLIEGANTVILSGAGLEDFLSDALQSADRVIDASKGIDLVCGTHDHEHQEDNHDHGHSHEQDPHIWLSPVNAKAMAANICRELSNVYPQYKELFNSNLQYLTEDLQELQEYGEAALADLKCRELITFHDGFSYFAEAFGLVILEAVEEESGSEASAAELIQLIKMVNEHQLPAVFIEKNGSSAAASIIATETGISCYTLDMAMSADSYFSAMYHNINTIREALQ